MRNDFWIGRDRAAMTPTFMLPRVGPATDGEGAALFLPERLPSPRRSKPGEPDAWTRRAR